MAGYKVTGITGGGRTGMPPLKPYRWRDPDVLRQAEVDARLATVRARIQASAFTGICEAVEGPSPEWRQELNDMTVAVPTFSAPPAAVKITPYAVNGRRKFWYVMPAALAAALSPKPAPTAAAHPARRCRRCGYLATRCTCRRPHRVVRP